MVKSQVSAIVRRVLPWLIGVVILLALPAFAQVVNPAAAPPQVSLTPAAYTLSNTDKEAFQLATRERYPLYVSRLMGNEGGRDWQPAAYCEPGAQGIVLASQPQTKQVDGMAVTVPGIVGCQTRDISLADFALQVQAQILAGQGNDGISVGFRSLNNGDSLRFQIGLSGNYSLANSHAVLMEGSSSRQLAFKETNTIAIVATGDLMRFYINGECIARTTFPGSHHEQHLSLLSYAIEQPTQVLYHDIKIWDLHGVALA